MIRTPIYNDVTPEKEKPGVVRSPHPDADTARAATRDDVITKIVKYVPGEVVAAFAAIFALGASVGDWAVWISLAFGLIATPGYFMLSAKKLAKNDQPRVYFYVLSIPAFLIWSLAVSSQIRGLLNVRDALSEWMLFAGAFAIPFVDEALTAVWPSVIKKFPKLKWPLA